MIIKKDTDSIRPYLEDTSNIRGGRADCLAIPEDTAELSGFIKEAVDKGMPVTISGGGTGTTGSRIPYGGAILSMERLNRMIDISRSGMSASVQAGLLVEDLKAASDKKELFYASHPTEKTASVGGTIATNASGARSFKYGPTRRYVKRLKMVLANGEIFDIRRGERYITEDNCEIALPGDIKVRVPLRAYGMPDVKNSAGYFIRNGMDLIDLFIGQEGTLSVIVEADIGLVKKPRKILSAFLFFKNGIDAFGFADEAGKVSTLAREKNGPGIEALSIEYFDANCIGLLRGRAGGLPPDAAAAIFFEQETTEDNESAMFDGWLKLISKYNVRLDDTWVAMNERDAERFLELRHSIPEAMNDMARKSGYKKLSTDMAVPAGRFGEMLRFYKDTPASGGIKHYIFGHIGECHLHVNLIPGSDVEEERARAIYLEFAKKAVTLGGTISAEHGIGKLKHKYLEMMYGKEAIVAMAKMKKSFDPNCILGLDNIFPRELLK